jgi:AcrR family transcriptional regulator
MAHATIDDTALAETLFEVFRNHGYEGATIAQLSEATGLKKSSLYHRFPAGKEDMARAVVMHVGELLQTLLITPLIDDSTSPEKRFDQMVTVLKAFYAEGNKNCLLNVLNLGTPHTEINQMLLGAYESVVAALTRLAKDAGIAARDATARATYFMMLLEGALVIQRLTGDAQTFSRSMAHAKKLFFAQ